MNGNIFDSPSFNLKLKKDISKKSPDSLQNDKNRNTLNTLAETPNSIFPPNQKEEKAKNISNPSQSITSKKMRSRLVCIIRKRKRKRQNFFFKCEMQSDTRKMKKIHQIYTLNLKKSIVFLLLRMIKKNRLR